MCLCVAEFEDKYVQQAPIGSGGFGSVYAGFRKEDSLPVSLTNTCSYTHYTITAASESANQKTSISVLQVAIKHVPRDMVRRERVVSDLI